MGSHREDHKEEETLAALQWFDSAKVRTNNDTKETSNSKKKSVIPSSLLHAQSIFFLHCGIYVMGKVRRERADTDATYRALDL